MKRSWLITIAFILCMAAAAGAMTWVTVAVLSLERAEAGGRRQAALEDAVRLALWRADSTLVPLVMQENLLPWFAYRPGATLPSSANADKGAPLAASSPYVLVHFELEADGRLVSPEVSKPEAQASDQTAPLAGASGFNGPAEGKTPLARVAAVATPAKLRSLLPAPPAQPPGPPAPNVLTQNTQFTVSPQQRAADRDRRSQMRSNFEQQGEIEYNFRNGAWNGGNSVLLNNKNNDVTNQVTVSNFLTVNVPGAPLTPLWLDGQLLLARRISVAGRDVVQGCLLDWPAIRDLLVDTVGDLLPSATFEPVVGDPSVEPARMLAALPLRIVPGDLPSDSPRNLSPIRVSLIVAWVCMTLAAAAVAGLLAGILRLSNRRASFVTAVTHELRTPLTTFQMYVEMLAEGMVPPGEPSRHYLKTLRAEVSRLTHMVENILAYARLERRRNIGRIETIAAGRLLDGMQARLAQRAEQAGMELIVESAPADCDCLVRASASVVEQVLFNLVDNACKYAADADDKRIHIELQTLDDRLEVRVRDHGPGMSPPRRWFRSFGKTAQEAAQSAAGIGLGLALSRRLARHIGGDLRVVQSAEGGACLALSLARSR